MLPFVVGPDFAKPFSFVYCDSSGNIHSTYFVFYVKSLLMERVGCAGFWRLRLSMRWLRLGRIPRGRARISVRKTAKYLHSSDRCDIVMTEEITV